MLAAVSRHPEVAATLFDGTAPRRAALLELLRVLAQSGYSFVTATPGTHTRVLARSPRRTAENLRDVLGWSLPFEPAAIPGHIFDLLDTAGAISPREDGLLGADVRVSTVHQTLFLHSAYPTLAHDSVFLGPDSCRFADLIVVKMGHLPEGARILDYAAGAGVGGIAAAQQQRQSLLVLADINPKASFLSSINAEFAGLSHQVVSATAPREVDGAFDLIVTHPPFMMDDGKRAYRDGGDLYGARLSLDWVLEGISKLTPGGKLVLHTGVSIVDGRDVLREEIERQVDSSEWAIDYHELDPDIFSEDLDTPPYVRNNVERIAAVGLCVTRKAAA
jgi:hypothetical protein